MTRLNRYFYVGAGLAMLAAGAAPAAASSVSDFYKGKRLAMYIGHSAGGGYDRYARTVARHMTRHIPGNPGIVSKNYPGAGGLRLANSIYNSFKQDGSVLAIIGRQIPLEDLIGNKKAKFKANKFNWLGSANQETSLCVFWHTSPIKTIDDMFKKNPIVGATGTGAGGEYAMMLNNLLGTKLSMITGYPGGVDINLAMERGEVHGRCAWSWSSITSTAGKWLEQKKIIFPIQIAMTKHKDLADVPLVTEFIKNDRDRKALSVILAPLTMGRPFAVGPKVPADRVAALRAAFEATMKDKTFLEEAKRGRLPINPGSGEDIQKLIAGLYALPADVIKHAADALSRTNNIKISKAVIKTYVHKGKITNTKRGGKRVKWKGKGSKGKLRVGGKTKVTIAGNMAKRKALKVGMKCTFTVKGAQKAMKIDCE